MINAISPIDGRYASKTASLQSHFSEEALIKYRILVEIRYLEFLSKEGIIHLDENEINALRSVYTNFSNEDAMAVKEIEKTTNHDVKAVEYFLKNKISNSVKKEHQEFIHFALTSQDINNTAMPLMLMEGIRGEILPVMGQLVNAIREEAHKYKGIPMFSAYSRTGSFSDNNG